MNILSEKEIVNKIKCRETFTATIDTQAFTLKIDKYLPAFSAAIHNGGNLRSTLAENCLLNKAERYFEEDPFTGSFIQNQAITLIGHDSRYEYDLNRTTEDSVYETAWGKDVWKKPLSPEEIATSKEKHAQFYRIVAAVVEALITDFGECIVYDNHSYNFKRHERTDLPVLNLGTTSVKSEQWRPVIDSWLAELNAISVEGLAITAAENDIFYGKGFLAQFCHEKYEQVLVLATESKKVFMDELTGKPYDDILPSYQQAYNNAIATHTELYLSQKNDK